MMTMDSLSKLARQTLPRKLCDEWFTARATIRKELSAARPLPEGRLQRYIPWDDPEYVARCAVKLAELTQRAQEHVNRFAGE